MADEDGKKDDGQPLGTIAWIFLGLVVGGYISWKYQQALGFESVDDLTGSQDMTRIFLLLAPLALFWGIGAELGKELRREKFTSATYWTTFFGVAASAFTLLGITGIDDIFP